MADLKLLFSELVRLETELWDAVEARLLADHGLTAATFEVIGVIARTTGCRVQDIAGALSITVGGTSKIVDRVEAAGLCARRANPADRRSSIIELTGAGTRAFAAAEASFADELERRLGLALPEPAERERLAAVLGELRSALRASRH